MILPPSTSIEIQGVPSAMLRTDDVPLVSSTHGRERRTQRDISKRDLQAAVKYGVKERGFPHPRTGAMRWKYTYNDIVYITDATSTVEVTSWALELPISPVPIPSHYQVSYEEAKRRLELCPKSITSHTVVLVDMSGSMNKSDMNGHRSRARGVYYNLAECLVAERLNPVHEGFIGNDCAYTDVVTLLEMRSEATVVFEREPFSWVLYNRFVALAELRDARNHGNYYPSFHEAFRVLKKQYLLNSNCGLALFFFTDGKPSDHCIAYSNFPNNLIDLFTTECKVYGSVLTFTAMCYGSDAKDFDLVQSLVKFAKLQGVKSELSIAFKDPLAIETALSKTASSLCETRTLLSRLNSASLSDREKSEYSKTEYWKEKTVDSLHFHILLNSSNSYVVRRELEWLEKNEADGKKYITEWVTKEFLNPKAAGIAVGKSYFGEGAERIVFAMTEIDAAMRPVGIPLVAKLSLYKHQESSLEHLRRWHRTFAKTQIRAKKYAKKFNMNLDNLGVSKLIPRIDFLDCSIYESVAEDGAQNYTWLVEKRLNPSRYIKWNDNKGGVDGHAKIQDAMADDGAALDTIQEGEDESDDDEDNDGDVVNQSKATALLIERILVCDIPQAFSHFTYSITKRAELVCDLQGELCKNGGYSLFEFTDPCIHSADGSKRYGKTDHGGRGIHAFLKSHNCNAVCALLKIDRGKYSI